MQFSTVQIKKRINGAAKQFFALVTGYGLNSSPVSNISTKFVITRKFVCNVWLRPKLMKWCNFNQFWSYHSL